MLTSRFGRRGGGVKLVTLVWLIIETSLKSIFKLFMVWFGIILQRSHLFFVLLPHVYSRVSFGVPGMISLVQWAPTETTYTLLCARFQLGIFWIWFTTLTSRPFIILLHLLFRRKKIRSVMEPVVPSGMLATMAYYTVKDSNLQFRNNFYYSKCHVTSNKAKSNLECAEVKFQTRGWVRGCDNWKAASRNWRTSVKKLLPPQAMRGIWLGMRGLVRSYVTLAILCCP
jgi:hypothetical protein